MNCLRRFLAHSGGVSAIEFAIAGPLLLLLLGGIVTGWTYERQMMELRSAVKSGANYVLKGGMDLDAAESTVLTSWANKPDDAAAQVVRQCTCGNTVSTCTAVCAGTGAIPDMTVIITASGSLDVPAYDVVTSTKMQTTHQEIIRVR
jgi:Flp pilus assembly protein TadG